MKTALINIGAVSVHDCFSQCFNIFIAHPAVFQIGFGKGCQVSRFQIDAVITDKIMHQCQEAFINDDPVFFRLVVRRNMIEVVICQHIVIQHFLIRCAGHHFQQQADKAGSVLAEGAVNQIRTFFTAEGTQCIGNLLFDVIGSVAGIDNRKKNSAVPVQIQVVFGRR